MKQPSIAIIGGGLTGLVAALRLSASGARVTVIEAGAELGGLAASFEMCGEPLEKAYHHLFSTDVEILSLIRELGLEDRLEWLESSVAIYRDGKCWPFMNPLDLLRFGACSFFGRLRLGFVALHLKRRKEWQSLVKTPAIKWMRRYCGDSATKAVWEPLLNGKFSHHAERVSMAWLWARLHIRSNSKSKEGGGERLGYIRGGFIKIINELEHRLKANGVSIVTNARASSIHESDDSLEIHLGERVERFDAALFTGSNPAFARILPDTPALTDYKTKLAGIRYLGAICLIFETRQQLGGYYWTNVNDMSIPFLVMIRHTKLVSPERYQGNEIYYLGAYVPHDDARFTMSDEELQASWFAALQKMYPDFDKGAVTRVHSFRFKDAQHVVDCDFESKIMPYETPMKGLFLSNFAQIFPQDRGTNFAVREGDAIALRMQSALNQPST